ncbi:MAG: DUF559 domain-containing protein [Gemmatimonadota bacterium]
MTLEDVGALAARHPSRAGMRQLRELLDAAAGPAFTRSPLEETFLAMVRRARLPAPEVNAQFMGREVDFLWRHEGVVVELDGYRFHKSRRNFEEDREDDSGRGRHRVTVIRLTARRLRHDSEAVLVDVAQALARAPARPATGAA